ncbi:MAG: hypothetical protein LBQ66_09235 [Planctomycetaceae bacterium]|nr:hypothetical protein [Planctomycetaceae bacterium]
MARKETRGAHNREDYSTKKPIAEHSISIRNS